MTVLTAAKHLGGREETWERAMVVRSLEDARDRELVRRVGGGDEEAFRRLFRRYGPVAKALAARVVRQDFMAEEIVQEAFLALWRGPGSPPKGPGFVPRGGNLARVPSGVGNRRGR